MKFIIFLLCITCSTGYFAQTKKVVVVIDAGHGGSDPGHLSLNKNHASEKALNLLIAKKVGGYIEKYLTNVSVIYTRTTDIYPSLDDRVSKANKAHADYFISIHCNGNSKRLVHGTESHIHSFSAKKSFAFAKNLEREFSTRAGRHSRGIKNTDDRERTLQVLKFTQMTSVLVECGFLTNEKEAAYLNSNYGQEIIASAIFRAFRTTITKEYPKTNFIKPIPSLTSNGTYAIQIMSSKDPIDTKSNSFKQLNETVIREKLNTTNAYKYRYIVGAFSSREEAKKRLSHVQQNGFKDSIIISINSSQQK
jgi:N-acetylmuramoyl-L-alanine amidase